MKKHTHSNQFCTISFSKRFLLLIVLAALLSSCGTVLQTPLPMATATELPTVTLTPEQTATATEMPTITPTPETTATVEGLENELIVQQMVEDFLNKAGSYTDEKIAELGFNLPEMDEQSLGLIVSSEEGYFMGQYILFDVKADENNQEGYYLLGGVDKNKKRFVFVAKQKYVFGDDIPGIIVHFSKSRIKISDETSPNNFNITSTEELLKLRDLYASKPAIINFTYNARKMAYLPVDIINILSDFLDQNQAEGEDLLNRSYSLNKSITNQDIFSDDSEYVLTKDDNFLVSKWSEFTGTAPVMSTFVVIEDLADWNIIQ